MSGASGKVPALRLLLLQEQVGEKFDVVSDVTVNEIFVI